MLQTSAGVVACVSQNLCSRFLRLVFSVRFVVNAPVATRAWSRVRFAFQSQGGAATANKYQGIRSSYQR